MNPPEFLFVRILMFQPDYCRWVRFGLIVRAEKSNVNQRVQFIHHNINVISSYAVEITEIF